MVKISLRLVSFLNGEEKRGQCCLHYLFTTLHKPFYPLNLFINNI